MAYHLLIVDNEEVVRAGLAKQLVESEFHVVAETGNETEALIYLSQRRFDLLILDVRMGSKNCLRILEERLMHFPELPVLVFSSSENPIFINRLYELNVSGYLSKSCSAQELISALRQIICGTALWTRQQLRQISGSLSTKRVGLSVEAPLTHRECDVLCRVCEGKTNKEIAAELDISYETVKEHVQHILRKVGVNDRTQAAVWAVRKGIYRVFDPTHGTPPPRSRIIESQSQRTDLTTTGNPNQYRPNGNSAS